MSHWGRQLPAEAKRSKQTISPAQKLVPEKREVSIGSLEVYSNGERTFTLSLGLGQGRRQLKKIMWLTILRGRWALSVPRTLPYKSQSQVSFLTLAF